MPDTEYAEWVFDVDQKPPPEPGDDPGPWVITYEPRRGELSPLDDGVMSFWLRPDTTEEEARQLTRQLNDLLDYVSYTDLRDVPGG